MAKEDEVREAAYYVWLNNGCPEGVEIDCWLEAEAQEGNKEAECCCCCCEEKPAETAEKKKPAAKKAVKTEAAEKKPAAKKAPVKKTAAKK